MTSRSYPYIAIVCFLLLAGALSKTMAQTNVQGQWSTLASTMPINPIHVALLSSGKVLVIAGSGNCPPSQAGCPSGPPYGPTNGSGALLLDPVSGQTIAQFSLSWDMFCDGMVMLADGRPLILGGTLQYNPFYGTAQAAIFDPSTNTFSNITNMAQGRWYPTGVTLGNGTIMVFSGLNQTGNTNTAVEFYTPGSGWSTQYVANWTPPLYPWLHLLPNGKVFNSGANLITKLFDPSLRTWTNLATTNYSVRRTYGSSVLLPLTPASNYDPRVIIMGGGNPATNTTETIDLGSATPAWHYGPNMSEARIEMNTVILPTGKVLALGGSVDDESASTASLNADLYDPATNTFSSAGANSFPRLYHSVALLLPDATVWVAGGNPSRGTYEPHMEIYQPAYLFNSDGTMATRPLITGAPSSMSYGNTFTLTTPDAANISSVVLVRNGTVTHAFGMDQREVGMSFAAGSGALTVTAPPNANIAPPGYYMLFIVNNAGVPSIAAFVQVMADFSVSATPASQTVAAGSSTSYTVNVTASSGFTGNVALNATGLPSGASAGFTPSSISGSGPSTMTVSTSSTTPAGTYTLSILGTSGAASHSAQVTLVVGGSDFSLSATPSSQTVVAKSSTTYTINVAPSNGFTGSVGFGVTGLPSGTTATFSPTSVSSSGSSTMTVSAAAWTKGGTYKLTITGTSGALTHSTQVTLLVANFKISATPSSQTVSRGTATAYTVTVTAQGPFTATVNLAVKGLPTGTSASFNPPSVVGSGNSTLTVAVSNTAVTGTYSLTINGTVGGLAHSASVSLVIQ